MKYVFETKRRALIEPRGLLVAPPYIEVVGDDAVSVTATDLAPTLEITDLLVKKK